MRNKFHPALRQSVDAPKYGNLDPSIHQQILSLSVFLCFAFASWPSSPHNFLNFQSHIAIAKQSLIVSSFQHTPILIAKSVYRLTVKHDDRFEGMARQPPLYESPCFIRALALTHVTVFRICPE